MTLVLTNHRALLFRSFIQVFYTGAGTSESSAGARARRALSCVAQREPFRSSKQTPGPVVDGGSWDSPGQVRYALPRNGTNIYLSPTWLWRTRVGETSPLGVQCCRRPVGNGRLLAIPVLTSKGGPYSTTGAVRGEPATEPEEGGLCRAVAHPGRHQRRHMDLQELAGKEAQADPPRGCTPDGRSDGKSDRSCRRQA